MKKYGAAGRLSAIVFCFTLLLAGCGGGGGGGGGTDGGGGGGGGSENPPVPENPPPPAEIAPLSFAPSNLTDVLFEDVPKKLRVLVTPTEKITGDVFVQISDASGILKGDAEVLPTASGSYYTAVRVGPLSIGRYRGEFDVRLCKDSACTAQHTAAVKLGFDLDVRTHTQLTALQPLSAPEWTTYQGNNAHTGFVPVTLDASRFSPRWIWKPAFRFHELTTPVSSEGRAYLSANVNSDAYSDEIIALDEASASTLWKYSVGHPFYLTPPAIADGRIFAATTGHENTSMLALNASTGENLFRTPFGSQWDQYLNPVVHDGKVYTNGGVYGGLLSFDANSGVNDWFFELNQFFGWSPTVANNRLMVPIQPPSGVTSYYGPVKTGLTEVSFDGELIRYTRDQARDASPDGETPSPSNAAFGTIVAANNGQTVAARGDLIRYNANGGIGWQLQSRYYVDPAVAGSQVFAVKGSSLEVRSLQTGALLWSWRPDNTPVEATFLHSPIVTENLVFFATDSRIYALDRVSHQPVWSYPMSGPMALSASGILYVRLIRPDNELGDRLAAISLN